MEEEGRQGILVATEEDQLVKLLIMEMEEMELHQQVDQPLIAKVEMVAHLMVRWRMETLEDYIMEEAAGLLMVQEAELVTMEEAVVPHSFNQELVVQVIQED